MAGINEALADYEVRKRNIRHGAAPVAAIGEEAPPAAMTPADDDVPAK